MKGLYELSDDNYIAMAKLIDNNFVGNRKIQVCPINRGVVRVKGHTDGGQCVNCDVKFNVSGWKLNGVYTQNEDDEMGGSYRHVMPPTLKKVIDYLKKKDFDYCPKP